jgi:hypothetical protein
MRRFYRFRRLQATTCSVYGGGGGGTNGCARARCGAAYGSADDASAAEAKCAASSAGSP